MKSAPLVALLALLAGPAYAGSTGTPPAEPPAETAPADPDAPTDPDTTDPDAPAVTRQVGEVTISRRGEEGNLLVPGNITVIDREKIEKSGARDVPDLLRREAGVFVTNDIGNPEGYRVEARGFNNGGGNGSRTLVLVNGRRVNEPRSDVPDWALIHLDHVERIEVQRGPASAVWGDNSSGGVIDIRTREGEGPPRFEARGGLGSYGNWTGSVFAGGSHGPVSASLFAHDLKDGGYRDRSLFRGHGGELNLGFDVGERVHLGVRGGYSSDDRERPGSLDELQKKLDRRQADPSNDDNFQETRQRFVDGTVEIALAEDVTLTSVAWYQMRRDRGAVGSLAGGFAFAEEADSWAIGANTQLEIDRPLCGHANQLVVGGDWLRERFRPESLFAFFAFPPPTVTPGDKRSKRYLYGFFLQNDFAITEDLIFSAGVRYDKNHREGTDLLAMAPAPNEFEAHHSEWSPRGALTWRVLEPLSIYASYAEGFRFPTLDETFGAFGFSPFLMPETSRTSEIGAKLRTVRASANFAFYHMNVNNEMFFDTEQAFPFGENVNLGRVRHRGVEFQGEVRPWDWLELYTSYTYDDVKIAHDPLTNLAGHRMPMIPRHRGTVGALALLPCDFEAGVNANWVSSRYLLNDVANQFPTHSTYSTYDAHVGFRPQIGKHVRLHLLGLVYNLFDRKYSEVAGVSNTFPPPTFALVRQRRFFPSAERNWEARVMIEVWR